MSPLRKSATIGLCGVCRVPIISVDDGWVHDQRLIDLRVSTNELEAAHVNAQVNATLEVSKRRYDALHQPKPAIRVGPPSPIVQAPSPAPWRE